MEISDVISQAGDTLTVKRVFGEPYEKNGVTVIPAARVQGVPEEEGRVPMARGRAPEAVSASTPARSGRSSSGATR